MLEIDIVTVRARQHLEKFIDPKLAATRRDLILALRPTDDDYKAVFQPDVIAQAKAGWSNLWEAMPPWPVKPDQTKLRLAVVYARDFVAEDAQKTRVFPGGYKKIARHLLPDVCWVAWEFVAPTASDGLFFDGLVPRGERWAWFPKPWRVLPE